MMRDIKCFEWTGGADDFYCMSFEGDYPANSHFDSAQCDNGGAQDNSGREVAAGLSCHSERSRRVDSFVPALLISDIRLDCESSSRNIRTATNTGHEHLDKYNLINMTVPNKRAQSQACLSYAEREVQRGEASTDGRVYDPIIGRFLSPDPVLQDPNNAQNYNKNSYVLNNPLKFTDPSGYRGQQVYRNLQAPDMLAENKKLNLSREAAWQAMKGQGGGNGVYAFLSVLCGGSGGGGGGNMFGPNPTASAPAGGDAGSGETGGEQNSEGVSGGPILGWIIDVINPSVVMNIAFYYNYVVGGGNVQLSHEGFLSIIENIDYYLGEIDYGGDYYLKGVSVGGAYTDIIGNAYLIMDRNDNVVGFHDTYDFDMETDRGAFAQFATGLVHYSSYLNPFCSSYTIYYFDPMLFP